MAVWVEKTKLSSRPHLEGIDLSLGKALWSPQLDKRGGDIYRNMREVKKGDIILHLVNNKDFRGISKVSTTFQNSTCPQGSKWDDGTGKVPAYIVGLTEFLPLKKHISANAIVSRNNERLIFANQ